MYLAFTSVTLCGLLTFFILLLDYALYFFRTCLHTSLFGPRRHGQLPRNRSCIEYGVDAGQLACLCLIIFFWSCTKALVSYVNKRGGRL